MRDSGETRDALLRQADELGVGSRLHLLGYRDDIANVLASGDVFVHPSRSGGSAAGGARSDVPGLPIVATDVGDVASVLDESSGLVVPPGDAAALAGALRVMLTDRNAARRFAAAALKRATEEYDLSRTVERYASLFATRLGLDHPA